MQQIQRDKEGTHDRQRSLVNVNTWREGVRESGWQAAVLPDYRTWTLRLTLSDVQTVLPTPVTISNKSSR